MFELQRLCRIFAMSVVHDCMVQFGLKITWPNCAFLWLTLGCCSFEGLCREEVPHGKGIIKFGNGWGGGIQNTNFGDR